MPLSPHHRRRAPLPSFLRPLQPFLRPLQPFLRPPSVIPAQAGTQP